MSRLWLMCVLVCLSGCVGVCAGADPCAFATEVLPGSTFEFSNFSLPCPGSWIPIIKQQGVSYIAPELRVVANTTVTFVITAHPFDQAVAFGLTVKNSSTRFMVGDALGLTVSPESLSDGSCYFTTDFTALGAERYPNNTFALNITRFENNGATAIWATQCTLTWKVPQPSNDTQYYYYVPYSPSSTPRRINIVTAPDVPSSSSSSSSSPPSSSASSSSSLSGASSSSLFSSSSSATSASASSDSSSGGGSSSSASSSSSKFTSSSSSTGPANDSASNVNTRVNTAAAVLAMFCAMLV